MQNVTNAYPVPQRNTTMLVVVAVVLFIVGTALHIFWGWFPKSIDVMPDEMRYLDTARSLFSGDGLVMRGEPSSFQKILYPLAISPALLFPNGVAQIQAIGVLNSIRPIKENRVTGDIVINNLSKFTRTLTKAEVLD